MKALLVFFLSVPAMAQDFVPVAPNTFERVSEKCAEMGGRLASIQELRDAVANEAVRPEKGKSYWAIPDTLGFGNVAASLMTAGMAGTDYGEGQRGIVDINRYGMPEHRVVYQCTEALEEGAEECARLKNEFQGKKAAYCVADSERNPASKRKKKK